jgi:hypothetical protein
VCVLFLSPPSLSPLRWFQKLTKTFPIALVPLIKNLALYL